MQKHLLNLVVLSGLVLPAPIAAQEDTTIRDVVDADAQEAELVEAANDIDLDLLDMSTPLRSIVNLARAADDSDMERIVQFLDMRYLPEGIDEADGPDLARQLGFVWSRYNILDLTTLSDEPEGHRDDGLPAYRDQLGVIETEDGPVPIYMQRIPGPDDSQVWKISNATISMTPDLWDEFGVRRIYNQGRRIPSRHALCA